MSFVTDVIVGNDESECARLGSAAIDAGGVEGDELEPCGRVDCMLSSGPGRGRWKEEGEDAAEEQADAERISTAAEQWGPRRAGPYKSFKSTPQQPVTPRMIATRGEALG